MQHGRDHNERELKVKPRQAAQGPEGADEALDVDAGEEAMEDLEAARAPDVDGAEVAPTRRAEERERERHREERKRGRMAAGIGENLRDRREPEVDRHALDEAARIADDKVVPHGKK
jgi:hypothetical protein